MFLELSVGLILRGPVSFNDLRRSRGAAWLWHTEEGEVPMREGWREGRRAEVVQHVAVRGAGVCCWRGRGMDWVDNGRESRFHRASS